MASILVSLAIKTAIRTVKSEIYKKNILDLALKDGSFEYIAIADVNLKIEGNGKRTGRPDTKQYARSKLTEFIGDTQRVLVAIRHKDDGRVEFLLLKRPFNEKVDMENPLSNCSAETSFKTNQGVSINNAKELAVLIMRDASDGSSYYQVENINIKLRQKYKRMFNIKILDTSRWTTKGGWSGWEMTELLSRMAQRRTGCHSVVQLQQQQQYQQQQYHQQQYHQQQYQQQQYQQQQYHQQQYQQQQHQHLPQQHSNKYDNNSFDVPVAEAILVHPESF
jgi:hypothetical protein